MIKIGVLGANGRMGQSIAKCILAAPDLHLAGGTSRTIKGEIIPGCAVLYSQSVEDVIKASDILIDFSLPAGMLSHVKVAQQLKKPFVTGTTGLSEKEMETLQEISRDIPLFWASNTSLGIAVLKQAVALIASKLDESFDIEILEAHHRDKKDAPSGTALSVGEVAAKARGRELTADEKQCRTGARKPGEIGFSAVRAGHIPADCSALFGGNEEILEIQHRALSRDVFAQGAIKAARWLIAQQAGFYSMEDMLEQE